MTRSARCHALSLLLATCLVPRAADALQTLPSPAVDTTVEVRWGVKIPTRDSVRLNATIYRPAGAGPLPVVFTFTPTWATRTTLAPPTSPGTGTSTPWSTCGAGEIQRAASSRW